MRKNIFRIMVVTVCCIVAVLENSFFSEAAEVNHDPASYLLVHYNSMGKSYSVSLDISDSSLPLGTKITLRDFRPYDTQDKTVHYSMGNFDYVSPHQSADFFSVRNNIYKDGKFYNTWCEFIDSTIDFKTVEIPTIHEDSYTYVLNHQYKDYYMNIFAGHDTTRDDYDIWGGSAYTHFEDDMYLKLDNRGVHMCTVTSIAGGAMQSNVHEYQPHVIRDDGSMMGTFIYKLEGDKYVLLP